jgi:hypothetical protein
MPTFRENLKDHPVLHILTGLASIVTIVTFFYFMKDRPKEKQTTSEINKDTITVSMTNEKVAKPQQESSQRIDTAKLPIIEMNDVNQNQKIGTKEETNLEEKLNEKETGFDLDRKTFQAMNGSIRDKIKFYDKIRNKYRFVGYYHGDDVNGTVIKKGNYIYVEGNYGKSQLELSDNNKILTGFIKGAYYDLSVNAALEE